MLLRKQGYIVLRIWGHSLKYPEKVIKKVKLMLGTYEMQS
jgi:very-short-patch-repair endonuclease